MWKNLCLNDVEYQIESDMNRMDLLPRPKGFGEWGTSRLEQLPVLELVERFREMRRYQISALQKIKKCARSKIFSKKIKTKSKRRNF